MTEMRRFVVTDRQGGYLFELDGRLSEAKRTEKLNGEHKLELRTTQLLEEGMRILVRDSDNTWREWVVDEVDESHANGEVTEGSYGCTWSVQYDLATVYGGELWPGTYVPTTATLALEEVLATQSIWEVGNVTVTTSAGTSLFDGQVWDYVGELVKTWGGEIEPRIVVTSVGVTHRYVDWLAHVGTEVVRRRFDYGHDCVGIRRKHVAGPRYCRVVPRGGHEATDADGVRYSDRVGVEEAPYRAEGGRVHYTGSKWVRDTQAEFAYRIPDGHGGYIYPEVVVTYDTDDPDELLDRAWEDLYGYTRPQACYEIDVLQLDRAGTSAHGVALGDEVHVVDSTFGPEPLRIQARVTEMVVDELDETGISLTIGNSKGGIEWLLSSMRSQIDANGRLAHLIEGGGSSTLVYLNALLDKINTEINATGGYVYVSDGEGLITYDKPVADPLDGHEATKVVQIKGGNIRIADSKKSSFSGINDWNWKTVIQSGHIAAELITAARITAGYIGNASTGSYWNLDNNTLQIATGAQIGSTTAGTLVSDTSTAKANAAQALSDADAAKKVATNYLTFNPTNGLDVGYSGTNAKTRVKGNGIEIFDGNGASEANFNGSGARLGIANKAHVVISVDSGIEMFDKDNVSVLFAGTSSGNSIIRVGKASGSGNVVMSSEGYVDVRNSSTILAHFGYGNTIDESGQTKVAPYYDIGVRKSGTNVGSWSVAEGNETTASYACAHAEGLGSSAIAVAAHAEGDGCTARSFASHAEGYECVAGASSAIPYVMEGTCHAEGNHTQALNSAAHTEGSYTEATGIASHAGGSHTIAQGFAQTAIGRYNVAQGSNGYYDHLLIVGNGTGSRSNALYLTSEGNLWIAGTLTQNSDRRLKEHHAYLGEDACEFVRNLKPALYEKDGARHVGFYAQDVQEAEPDGWDTDTVTAQHTDESLDFDPLTLDYNALMAPLVAYAQSLERRVIEQQSQIDELSSRLSRLESTLA